MTFVQVYVYRYSLVFTYHIWALNQPFFQHPWGSGWGARSHMVTLPATRSSLLNEKMSWKLCCYLWSSPQGRWSEFIICWADRNTFQRGCWFSTCYCFFATKFIVCISFYSGIIHKLGTMCARGRFCTSYSYSYQSLSSSCSSKSTAAIDIHWAESFSLQARGEVSGKTVCPFWGEQQKRMRAMDSIYYIGDGFTSWAYCWIPTLGPDSGTWSQLKWLLCLISILDNALPSLAGNPLARDCQASMSANIQKVCSIIILVCSSTTPPPKKNIQLQAHSHCCQYW